MANVIQIKRSSSAAAPATLSAGELAYSEASGAKKLFIGNVAGDTVVQLADFAKVVSSDANTTFTGTVSVATPSVDAHAATKLYVDTSIATAVSNSASAFDFKQSVVSATTAPVALDGTEVTVDGVAVVSGQRILVKNQASAVDNGIYVASTTVAWARAADANTDAEFNLGAFVTVEAGGTANGNSQFFMSGKTGALGTGEIAFSQLVSGITYTGSDGVTKVGNDFRLDNHSAAKITSGTLDAARLPSGTLNSSSTIDGGTYS